MIDWLAYILCFIGGAVTLYVISKAYCSKNKETWDRFKLEYDDKF